MATKYLTPIPPCFIAAANEVAALAAVLMRDGATLARAAAMLQEGRSDGISSLTRYRKDRQQHGHAVVDAIATRMEDALAREAPEYAKQLRRSRKVNEDYRRECRANRARRMAEEGRHLVVVAEGGRP